MLRRWRQWRLENAEDALDDAESEVARWELFERNHGGFKSAIRSAKRKVARAERRLSKRRAALGEEQGE